MLKQKLIIPLLLSLSVALSCCSKTELNSSYGNEQPCAAQASLLMEMNIPISSGVSRVSDTKTAGTSLVSETIIRSIRVIGFNDALAKVATFDIPTTEFDKIGDGTVMARPMLVGKVDVIKAMTKIFVVINASEQLKTQLDNAATFTALNTALASSLSGLIGSTEAPSFTMVNAPSAVGAAAGSVIDANGLCTLVSKDQGSRLIAKLSVERLVSKIRITQAKNLATARPSDCAGFEFIGYALTTTNKTFIPYAPVATYTYTDDTGTHLLNYRKDSNYGVDPLATAADVLAQYNWLNTTTPPIHAAWVAIDAHSYSLENSAQTDNVDHNISAHITKAVIKASYQSSGCIGGTTGAGESWFIIEEGRGAGASTIKRYTLTALKELYVAAVAGATANAAIVTALDAFRTTCTTQTVDFASITEAEILPNAGYLSSLIAGSIGVTCYSKGICYYEVPINHNSEVKGRTPYSSSSAQAMLGRWGIIRNNLYTLQINSITSVGLSYLATPTIGASTPINPWNYPLDPPVALLSTTITIEPWVVTDIAADLVPL